MRTIGIEPADGKDFAKVELRDDGNIGRDTPHCTEHGAMHKTYRFEEGGGFWNCSALTERGERHLEIVANCDAGCVETTQNREEDT